MKTYSVKVTRTSVITTVESTVVAVMVDDDEILASYEAERRAKTLVEAQIDCGHQIDWSAESRVVKSYPAPLIAANMISSPEPEVQIPAPVRHPYPTSNATPDDSETPIEVQF